MDKKQKGGQKIRREMEKKLCNGKTGTSWYTPGIRKREEDYKKIATDNSKSPECCIGQVQEG